MVLLLALLWEKYLNSQERSKMVNALISRTVADFHTAEMIDKTPPVPAEAFKNPDLVAESDLSDKEFEDTVLKQIA